MSGDIRPVPRPGSEDNPPDAWAVICDDLRKRGVTTPAQARWALTTGCDLS